MYTQDQLDARIAQCASTVPGNYCTGGKDRAIDRKRELRKEGGV